MTRIVFFRIGWMKSYAGYTTGDTIRGGGAWPEKGEVFNFLTFKNNFYGFVQPPARANGVNLLRIDPSTTSDKLTGVTVVWIANRPGGGSFIVGWYQNATIYALQCPAPAASKRDYGSGNIGYFAKSKATDCKLLEDDERTFEIQRGKGYPGRSNIFYGDKSPAFPALKSAVLSYIKAGGILKKGQRKSSSNRARQPDILKRIAVEKAAIETVGAHYSNLGYTIESVERDNVGWDLTAINGNRTIHLEVKGLSGSAIIAELTPNEHRLFSENSPDYRLCIVCQALEKPVLHIFSYENETGIWSTTTGETLLINEIISARVSA